FGPERLSPAWDVVAMSGVAFGIAFIVWGGLRARRGRTAYVLGGTGADIPLAGLDAFPLVATHAGGFAFARPPGMTGDIVSGGATQPLPDAAPLGPGTRIR